MKKNNIFIHYLVFLMVIANIAACSSAPKYKTTGVTEKTTTTTERPVIEEKRTTTTTTTESK